MKARIFVISLFAAAATAAAAVEPAMPPRTEGGNPVVCGNKRITLVTPTLIRLEYAENGRFLDAPTMFAVNRDSMMREGFSVTELDGGRRVEINTGKVRMVFNNDNLPFGQGNTEFHFTRMGKPAKATARNLHSKTKRMNLGGSIATLDGVAGEVPLDDGLLSVDGWHHLIDTGTEILTPDGWFARRPDSHVQDQYCFIYGDDFHAPFADLGVISGHVPMTRKYMHGIWYSRWYPYDDNYIRELTEGFSEHGFPLDVLSMDMDWHTLDAEVGFGHNNTALGWTGHTWNRKLISDPAATIAALHADSIYVCVNEHPHDGIRPHEYCYEAFMKAMGEDPASGKTLLFDAGDRRYMRNYIAESRRENHAIGVDFWWLDWQQDYLYPYVRGSHMRHVPWLNRLYYADTERDGLRGAGYSRWGGWGDHRHPINFSGDARSNWDVLTFEVKLTQTSGNAGCYYWAHDIGGFAGETQPELLARWSQFGAVSAALRTHAHRGPKADRRPWIWGEKASRSMLNSYRLRSELMPYIYSAVRRTHESMLPFTRCMAVDWPTDSMAFGRYGQYMLGDILLAAPVTSPGTGADFEASKEVWFPPCADGEGWYDFFTDERHAGASVACVTKDLYSFPLFVRGGRVLPMQPFTQRPGSHNPEHLVLRVYPGAEGCDNTDRLYEDDGVSVKYLKGEYAVTPLRYSQRDGKVTITAGGLEGNYSGCPSRRAYTVELAGFGTVKKMKVNGKSKTVSRDADGRIRVEIPRRKITEPLKIEFHLQ